MRARPWRCAGGARGAGSGRATARTAHAAAGPAAEDPADPGALAAQAPQGARMEYGREIVDGFASRGELPIPLRGAPGAAVGRGQGGLELTCDGFVSGENGQQSEQELEQGQGQGQGKWRALGPQLL